MSYIRYKTINNKTYAYEVTAQWNSVLKQSRSVSKYLGPVDLNTHEIKQFKKKHNSNEKEKLILDFGDGYFLYEFIRKSELFEVLNNTIFQEAKEVFPLIIYRLCYESAMYNFDN